MWIALDSAECCVAVIYEYKHRRVFYARADTSDIRPWVAEIRRASTPELHSALPRVK